MKTLNDLNMTDHMIRVKRFVILYFSSENCDVCKAVAPKFEKLLGDYPEIDCYRIDMDENPDAAGKFGIYGLPGIIGYVQGKETIREVRYISLKDLREKLDRYYDIIF